MLELRPYQSQQIADAKQALRQGCKRLLLQGSTGSGKTVLTAAMLASAAAKGKRAWFVVHRKELIDQSVRTFVEAAELHVGIIAAGYPSDSIAPVQVCGVGSLRRRIAKVAAPDLIVWDECFVGDTIVGDRRIDEIGVGSFVPSLYGQDRVVSEFLKHAPDRLYRLTSAGRTIVCTGNHPFLTKRGWINAAALVPGGDRLYGVRALRQTDHEESESCPALPRVLSRLDVAEESGYRTGTDANAQSDAVQRESREGVGHAQGDGALSARAWRQWQAFTGGCASLVGRARMAIRSRREDRRSREGRTLDALQDRHRPRRDENRYRSGRPLALPALAPSAGSQERSVFAWLRLDRVEILQRGSDGEFERVCPNGRVYNLETERTHTYIANGFVVHNCHHLPSKSWSDIAAALPGAVHIGLTATPSRLDGRGLRPFFDALLCGPSTADLIAAGYLSPYRLFAPATFDASKLRKVAGDYNRAEVSATIKPTVIGDAVGTYRKHADGGRALVFAWSLEASRAIAEAFNTAGIAAAHVDGETPADERKRSMDMFRSGDVRVICNCELFGEGLDVPAVDAVFLLRPTASLGLYLQQVGRGLRTAPGKSEVMLFDHVNNYTRHGLPDDTRAWTLDGIEKKAGERLAPMKRCPECFLVSGAMAKACPHCGALYPVKPRKVVQVAGELAETELSALRARLPELQRQCSTLKEFQALGKSLGYAHGWGFLAWQRAQKHRSPAQPQARPLAFDMAHADEW